MIIGKNKVAKKDLDLRKSKEYVFAVKQIINDSFNQIKNLMIMEFDSHPVTREIEAGANASNISRTLGGNGNLFSFIGFEKGDNPTAIIRNMLISQTYLNSIVVKRDGSVDTIVSYPQPKEIFAVTPLPWADGRSWAEGIERGMSGLGFYLNTKSLHSRSGSGIQSENKIRSAKFNNVSYISAIIRNFEKQIIALNKRTV